MTVRTTTSPLAVRGGAPEITDDHTGLFHWPIVTDEDIAAVADVMRRGITSSVNINQQFEAEWGQYIGTQYNLCGCNGTMSVLTAMFAAGVGRGDEVICPSVTFWGSCFGTLLLGATAVYADLHPTTLTIDPDDVARKITPRTRAIVAVHYRAHAADMDRLMALAEPRGIKVIEDVSHAHGSMYKGRMCGALGHVSAASLMGTKSLVAGEGGVLSTNDRAIWERAVCFCHYERVREFVTDPKLRRMVMVDGRSEPMPLVGLKGRMNQMASAYARVQLKHYPARIAEIDRAIRRFGSLIEDIPGLKLFKCPDEPGWSMGGWFQPMAWYDRDKMAGVPVDKFIAALKAEGTRSGRAANFPQHLHPAMRESDVFHDGKPTRLAFTDRDVLSGERRGGGGLPVSESIHERTLYIPYFKHDDADKIEQHAAAWRKVAARIEELA